MKRLLLTLLLTAWAGAGWGADWHVSATGTAGGKGTVLSPWDLATALASPSVSPGDTVYLKSGGYYGAFTLSISGTVGNPITIRNYPNGRPILDVNDGAQANGRFNLNITGDYVTVMGLEFTNTNTTRTNPESGSHPTATRDGGVNVENSDGVKIINCVVYDAGFGLGLWSPCEDMTVSGNILFNNGWDAPDRLHGHGIYAQNATAGRVFSGNIIFGNLADGWHLYSQSADKLQNFTVENSISFRDRQLFGGYGAGNMYSLRLVDTYCYDTVLELGYVATGNDVLELDGGYCPSGKQITNWTNVTITDDPVAPQADGVFWLPNEHDAALATAIIYNYSNAESVTITDGTVNGFLSSGQHYQLINVQQWNEARPLYQYAGEGIAVQMTGRGEVQEPTGYSTASWYHDPLPSSTFPTFGVFIVKRLVCPYTSNGSPVI